MGKDYLLYVQQRHNMQSINQALNELYVEEDDYKSLRESVENYDKFDQIDLAQKLQKHELLEFRRISAFLYRINKRWAISIPLSKQDKVWQDAMNSAALSNSFETVEELLRFFVDNIETKQCPESCFAAILFTCFDLIKPEVVLELSWKYNLFELSMPYLVQAMQRFNDNFVSLNKKVNELEEKLVSTMSEHKQPNNNDQWNNHIQPAMPMIGYMNNNNNKVYGDLGLM